MKGCAVCGQPRGAPAFRSPLPVSMTSIGVPVDVATEVHVCDGCGHVETQPLKDLADYYANHYDLLVESDEEDNLYAIEDGRHVFRAEHQARTLLATLDLPPGADVLDFGSGKGATLRRVLQQRPDVRAHFFDVNDSYRPFWSALVPEERTAVGTIPAAWHGRMDVVTSFFALEHVADPGATARTIRGLLKPGGRFYFLVPNAFANRADFIVVDHTHHYSAPSLARMLRAAGFDAVAIDETSHQGSFVVCARKGDAPAGNDDRAAITRAVADARDALTYWSRFVAAVGAIEHAVGARPCAIYGAGFHGSLLLASLRNPAVVRLFIDQNPFLHGKAVLGRPVADPAALPDDIADVMVGLNPNQARAIIADVPALRKRPLSFHFL